MKPTLEVLAILHHQDDTGDKLIITEVLRIHDVQWSLLNVSFSGIGLTIRLVVVVLTAHLISFEAYFSAA